MFVFTKPERESVYVSSDLKDVCIFHRCVSRSWKSVTINVHLSMSSNIPFPIQRSNGAMDGKLYTDETDEKKRKTQTHLWPFSVRFVFCCLYFSISFSSTRGHDLCSDLLSVGIYSVVFLLDENIGIEEAEMAQIVDIATSAAISKGLFFCTNRTKEREMIGKGKPQEEEYPFRGVVRGRYICSSSMPTRSPRGTGYVRRSG